MFRYLRGPNVLARGRFLWPTLPYLHILPLFFSLGDSPGNTPLYLMAALMDGGPGGLLHLIHGLGCGAAVTGLLSDGAAAPLLLGQLLFQLGRHDTAGPLLDRLTVPAFALIFDFVTFTAFFKFSYKTTSKK